MSDLPKRLIEEINEISPNAANFVKSWGNYITNEPNPIMQCMYLSIVITAWTLMVIYGYPLIDSPDNTYIASYHCQIGYVVYAVCLFTFHRACTVPAGDLNELTIEKYDNYPYDNVLYVDRICKTLKFRKVARSKFDRATKRQVPRFDHFCVWLNQPVGEENYRDFLLFLLVHCGMLSYGACASLQILRHLIVSDGLFDVKFYNVSTGQTVNASHFVIFKYLSSKHPFIICLFVLSAVMGVVMIGFTGFHLWICSRGMTTNEYFKWRDIWGWHKHSTEQYARAKAAGKAGKRWSPKGKDYEVVDGWVDIGSKGAIDEDDDDTDVGCTGTGAGIKKIRVLDEDEDEEKEEGEAKEEKEKLVQDPGPLPKNIYNKGIINNFVEVLFPRSLRATQPNAAPKLPASKGKKKKKS